MLCAAWLLEMLNRYESNHENCAESDPIKNFLIEEIKVLKEVKWIGLPNFMPQAAFLSLLQRKLQVSTQRACEKLIAKQKNSIQHVMEAAECGKTKVTGPLLDGLCIKVPEVLPPEPQLADTCSYCSDIFDDVMCANDSRSVVMKAVINGACDSWIKPLSEDQIKFIWKHVAMKVFNETKKLEINEKLGVEVKKELEKDDSKLPLIGATREREVDNSDTKESVVEEGKDKHESPPKKARVICTNANTPMSSLPIDALGSLRGVSPFCAADVGNSTNANTPMSSLPIDASSSLRGVSPFFAAAIGNSTNANTTRVVEEPNSIHGSTKDHQIPMAQPLPMSSLPIDASSSLRAAVGGDDDTNANTTRASEEAELTDIFGSLEDFLLN
ncbi:unnamed protein product [Trifolium pratense]|uniref:Uncharacterized protein n=1 Tax=Trifolium pratense TaxID=57577 RepID=A0ACB0M5D8_TRIPR|nr:unnamed protein product [Trifolium pratense]